MISYQVPQFGAPLQRHETATPQPQGREVLLAVHASGVCHTDVHTWHGWYDLGAGRRLTLAERGATLPLTLGHEIAGEVVALGPEVDAAAEGVHLGQRVLAYPWLGCGQCKVCRRGQEQLCAAPRFLGIFRAGGYASHVLVPDAHGLVDIGDLPAAQAAPYACSGLTMFTAIRRIRPLVLREEPVVLIGAGGLGLMALMLLRALGSPGVVVVETSPLRRQAALEGGALAAIDPASADAAAQVKAALGGAAWAVLDCVGSGETVQLGLDLLTKGGQFIQVGLFGGQVTLSTPLVPMRSISIEGSYVGALADLRELVALVREKRLPAIPTTCCALATAGQALQDLEAGRVVGRLILQPGAVK